MKRVIEMQKGCRRCQGDRENPKFTIHFSLGADSTSSYFSQGGGGTSNRSDKLRGIRPPMILMTAFLSGEQTLFDSAGAAVGKV